MTAALLSAAICAPVLASHTADGVEIPHYSHAAMGCMKLKECTEGVTQIRTVDELVAVTTNRDFRVHRQEIQSLLDSLDAVGVSVNVATGQNFPRSHRGVYYTDDNAFYLNLDHVKEVDVFLKVLRHEGWHAAQDCMAGTIDNTMMAIIMDADLVPQKYKLDAEIRYGMLAVKAIPWEQEAIWAGNTPGMTERALAACASDTPMWWIYEPTPKTAFWLRQEGYNVTPPENFEPPTL